MPQVKTYNLEGEAVGTVDLDDKIFNETAKPELIYQVARVLEARKRRVLAHTKDRSEVRGGGKKPWRQKGTGRARHGSIRSPIWRGGGVTFGPTKERNFSLQIPRKMSKKALRAVLSDRVAGGNFFVLEADEPAKPSTKTLNQTLKKLDLAHKKVLFLTGSMASNLSRSLRNLPKVKPLRPGNINVLELLAHPNILLAKSLLPELEKQLS